MSRAARVAVYTDSVVLGGSEIDLQRLVEGIDARFELTVVGTDELLVNRLAATRPGRRTLLLPAVTSKWNLGATVAHLRRIPAAHFDVLHANLRIAWSCQYAILAGLLSPGTAVAGTLHSILPPYSTRHAWMTGRMLSQLDALVAVSRTAAAVLHTNSGVPIDDIRVIESGVPAWRSDRWRLRTGPVIGAVGRLAPEKRFDVLLDALAVIPAATAVLVGDGPEREPLERRAARLGISDRVVFAGWQDDVGHWLGTMDVLVVTSEREAGSLSMTEAMHAGVPAVATDLPAIREIVGDNHCAVLTPVGDAGALAAALQGLIADPARRRNMGEAARALARRRFALGGMLGAYEQLYDELADLSSRTSGRSR